MPEVFRYKVPVTDKNPAGTAVITADEIARMGINEFLLFKNRLVNVRHRERYDIAVYEPVLIKDGLVKDLFRKGNGQQETFATSEVEFKKTRRHTNMHRGGEFEQGSLIIIEDISAPKAFTPGRPTTVTNGIVTNCKATFPPDFDAGLTLDTWLQAVELDYREGETSIKADALTNYPQNSGVSGVLGASQGGIIQNAFNPRMALENPRVLEGGDDFSVRLLMMQDFDASAAGINMPIAQKVILHTIELITLKN